MFTSYLVIVACSLVSINPLQRQRPPHLSKPGKPETALVLACATAKSVSFLATHNRHVIPGNPEEPSLRVRVTARQPGSILALLLPQVVKRPRGASHFSYEAFGVDCNLYVANPAETVEYRVQGHNPIRGKPLTSLRAIPGKVAPLQLARLPLIFNPRITGVVSEGKKTVNGRKANCFSILKEEDNRKWVIYVDPQTRLPVRITEWLWDPDSPLYELSHTDYSKWILNAEVKDSEFVFSQDRVPKLVEFIDVDPVEPAVKK